jgi:hypothetical protein
MGASLVVIFLIRFEQMAKMLVAEHNDMVKAIQDRQGARPRRDGRHPPGRAARSPDRRRFRPRATRQAHCMGSVRPGTRRPRSSIRSTGRSTRLSPTPKMRARLADIGSTALPGSPAELGNTRRDDEGELKGPGHQCEGAQAPSHGTEWPSVSAHPMNSADLPRPPGVWADLWGALGQSRW